MRLPYWLLVLLAGAVALQPVRADGDPPPEQTIKRFAAAMAAFPFYQCRYTLASGDGAVDEATHAVKWKKKATVECRYAVDGEFEAFEQFSDSRPDPSKVEPAAGGLGILRDDGFPAMKTIRGADGYGRWMEIMGSLQLTRAGRKYADGEVFAPLDFAFGHRRRSGPDDMLTQPNLYRVSAIEVRVIGGHRCVGVQLELVAPDDNWVERMWFDPDWGMMPVWCESSHVLKGKTYASRDVVTAAKAVSNGRWFPERMVRYTPGDPRMVWEYTLKEVDADRRPTRDELSVALPARTGVYDPETNKGFKLRQDEKLSGHDLAELFDKALAAKDKPMDTAIAHRSGRSVWFWACGAAGLLLAFLGGYRWLRSRRSAGPASGSP